MDTSTYTPGAAAHVTGGTDPSGPVGWVTFQPQGQRVRITVQIRGLPDTETGFFALHIHEGRDCSGDGFPMTGSHYNPTDAPHPRHAGDLPPLLSCAGEAYLQVLTDRFTIPEIMGRTVVIHNGADDFRSQPAGNAGEKIACGVIYPT